MSVCLPRLSRAVALRSGAAVVALLALTGTSPPAHDPGTITLVLKPQSAKGSVTGVDVTMDLTAATGQAKAENSDFSLMAAVVYPGAPGVADRMSNLVVLDSAGQVPLKITEDAAVPGGFPYFRHWKAERPVHYPVRVRYSSAIMPAGGKSGPAFGIRAVGGGFAGAGPGFLMVPETGTFARSRVHWDLSAMPKGAVGAMSYGAGDTTIVGGVEPLAQSWFMAGPANTYPAKGTLEGFAAMWLGQPVFDMQAAMARAAQAHRYMQGYFPHMKSLRDYRIFVQFRDAAPYGGGTALDRSFMLSRGPLAPGEQAQTPNAVFFHEMIHQWSGFIEAPQGISSWFSEGLTTFYEDELQWRGGFESTDAYLDAVNLLAKRYFTSKARNMAAADVVKVGFGDEEVRHIVYYRAALYFHDLDARIRAHSGGKRDLESLLFPIFLSREKGVRFDTEAWLAAVSGELGEGERGRFQRLIIDGSDTLDPSPDVFGPCFTREATTFDTPRGPIAGYRWVRVAAMAHQGRCAQ